jgi:uncharacterized protein
MTDMIRKYKLIFATDAGEYKAAFFDGNHNVLFDDQGIKLQVPEKLHSLGKTLSVFTSSLKSNDFNTDVVWDYRNENSPKLKKDEAVYTLRLRLGDLCNYSCHYCPQKYHDDVDFADIDKDVDALIEDLKKVQYTDGELMVQFWGGEPLVYWSSIVKLVSFFKLHRQGKQLKFYMICNGSLLTDDKVDFLLDLYREYPISLGISHDSYWHEITRGKDIFDSPKRVALINKLIDTMGPMCKFVTAASKENHDMIRMQEFFKAKLGRDEVYVESRLIRPYTDEAMPFSVRTRQDMWNVVRSHLSSMYDGGVAINYTFFDRIWSQIQWLMEEKPVVMTGAWCSAHSPGDVTVDAKGKVYNCHLLDESSCETGPWEIGTVTALRDIEYVPGMHHANRKWCSVCPILPMCQGGCFVMSEEKHQMACNADYAEFISIFAAALNEVTGMTLVYIYNPKLPVNRRDFMGLFQDGVLPFTDLLLHPLPAPLEPAFGPVLSAEPTQMYSDEYPKNSKKVIQIKQL